MSQSVIKSSAILPLLEQMSKDMRVNDKGMRLSNQQKSNIENTFEIFVNSLNTIEQQSYERFKDRYIFTEEYKVITEIKKFLYTKPFTVFACFTCNQLVKIQHNRDKFTKSNGNYLHRCTDVKVGEGVQTNWKTLYYLLIKNNILREQILNFITGDRNT